MESKSFPGVVDSLDELRAYVGELAQKAGLAKKATYSLKLAIWSKRSGRQRYAAIGEKYN